MKQKDVRYPRSLEEIPLPAQVSDLALYLRLSAEFGRADEGEKIYEGVESAVKAALAEFQQLVLSASDPDEPDALEEIRALRPDGPRVLVQGTPDSYSERLRGAFLGRMAGCTLGAALEFEPIGAARSWALRFGDSYPLSDYWSEVRNPENDLYAFFAYNQQLRGAFRAEHERETAFAEKAPSAAGSAMPAPPAPDTKPTEN